MTDQKTPSKVVQAKLHEITPNGWNPHGMTDKEFIALRESVREKGVYRPIVVVELDQPDEYTPDISYSKYRIVDGEHLFKAVLHENMENAGTDEVTVLVYGKNSLVPIDVQMEIGQQINHGLRGSLEDTEKTGKIVEKLALTRSIEEIARRTGQSMMFLETARRTVEPVTTRRADPTLAVRKSAEREGQTIPLVFEDNATLERYITAIKEWEVIVDPNGELTPGRRRIAAVLAAVESDPV